jgi:glycosyltransferase involved in cell wall biosynthesis
MEPPHKSIAVVVKGYPRLSETFVAQEILALQRRGFRLQIVSLRRPTDAAVHPLHRSITCPVLYLPEYLRTEPERVRRAWRRCRREVGYRTARNAWLADLVRDPTPNRARRFGQALVMSTEMRQDIGFLYVHFLHTPGSVTRYASLLTGIPWACSAHAKDIWTTPEWEIRRKLEECDWLVTCTGANAARLTPLADSPRKVSLIYHGLDFDRFDDPQPSGGMRSPDSSTPVILLSVGRAVEKKGYEDLLKALSLLPQDLDWRFVHVGAGALLSQLKDEAAALGISERIHWRGPQPQDEVLKAYRSADVFVLSSRVAGDGDRDGLPNVLMEAQSQKLPCVSTRVSGIPELIEHGVTGLLVDQKDPAGVAGAVERLMRDPELRRRLGRAGFERVRDRFSLDRGIDKLAGMFPKSVRPFEDRILRTA